MCNIFPRSLSTVSVRLTISTIGKGKDLTETEKNLILALAEEDKSVLYISEKVGRSKTAVHNIISASKSGRSNCRPGPKLKISKAQHRAIIRAASKGTRTAHEIRGTYNCYVNVCRFQQVLRKAPHLKHKQILTGPILSIKHKEERVK